MGCSQTVLQLWTLMIASELEKNVFLRFNTTKILKLINLIMYVEPQNTCVLYYMFYIILLRFWL